MRCRKCNQELPDDSLFCPYCGETLTAETMEAGVGDAAEREKITNNQRYFDSDFGISDSNPIVVSSVTMMGYYLKSFRSEDGEPFTWEFEKHDGDPLITKYNLFVKGKPYKSVYFNPNGTDSKYIPEGIVLDELSLEALKQGKTREELEEERRNEEQERIHKKEEEEQTAIRLEEERKEKIKKAEIKKASDIKKAKTAIKIIIPILVVLALALLAFIFRDFLRYSLANIELKAGKYDRAIVNYTVLGDYQDSQEKLREANFGQGNQLYNEKDYENAIEYLSKTGVRDDAKELIRECKYQQGLTLFNSQDYETAFTVFEENASYKDSAQYAVSCLDELTKQAYENKEYEKAYNYYSDLKSLDEANEIDASKYDTSHMGEISICYAKELLDKKDDTSISYALFILKNIKDETYSNEAKQLISEAETIQLQKKYDSAKSLMTSGRYEEAIEAFDKIIDFSDSKEQRKECIYHFIQKCDSYVFMADSGVFFIGDLEGFAGRDLREKYYKYAKELSDADYKDSKEYYTNLTKWRASITINNDENDAETKMNFLDRYDTFFGHIKITGGEFDAATEISYRITLPTGKVLTDSLGSYSFGDKGWCYAYYTEPAYAVAGTITFEILDSNGTVLVKEDASIR